MSLRGSPSQTKGGRKPPERKCEVAKNTVFTDPKDIEIERLQSEVERLRGQRDANPVVKDRSGTYGWTNMGPMQADRARVEAMGQRYVGPEEFKRNHQAWVDSGGELKDYKKGAIAREFGPDGKQVSGDPRAARAEISPETVGKVVHEAADTPETV